MTQVGFATGGNAEAPSVQCPCPTCGSTGAAMVDWAGYAGELEALLRELRAWVRLPPHLEGAVERLLPEARRPLAEGVAPSPPCSVTGPTACAGAEQLRLAAARPAPVAAR